MRGGRIALGVISLVIVLVFCYILGYNSRKSRILLHSTHEKCSPSQLNWCIEGSVRFSPFRGRKKPIAQLTQDPYFLHPIIPQKKIEERVHTLNFTIPVNSTSSFSWDDGVDYDSMAQTMLEDLLGDENNMDDKFILFRAPVEYGFANQFRAFVSTMMLALVTNRRFRVLRFDWFFVLCDSPLKRLMGITTLDTKQKAYYKYDLPKPLKDVFPFTEDLSKKWKKRVVLFDILSDISWLYIHNPLYIGQLQKYGFNSTDPSVIMQRMNRMLLRPVGDLADAAVAYRSLLKSMNHTIGIQIRSGGQLSNASERSTFLDLPTAESIPLFCSRLMLKREWQQEEVMIFLTSDSDSLMYRLQSQVRYPFHYMNVETYRKGHTSTLYTRGSDSLPTFKRSVLDVLLLSFCDALLITQRSSFGSLAGKLADVGTPSIVIMKSMNSTVFDSLI